MVASKMGTLKLTVASCLDLGEMFAALRNLNAEFRNCILAVCESSSKSINLFRKRLDSKLEAAGLLAEDYKLERKFKKRFCWLIIVNIKQISLSVFPFHYLRIFFLHLL